MNPYQRLTIVLLGNTGVGKSASGNTILGCQAFESGPSFKSLTTKVSEATETVFGIRISVVDTPGILGCEEEIKTWCQDVLKSSTPCLFLVVVSIGRFTDEQEKALRATIPVITDEGLKKSFLLFTNGDRLKNMSLEDFIFQEEEGLLPDIVKKFAGKYHLFNNENRGQEQVRELLLKSNHLKTTDQGSPDAGSGESVSLEETRIILFGLPGAGKTLSGNTILGSDQFNIDLCFSAVSTETVSKSAEVAGRQVTVVDTPGFSDEVLTPQQLYDEIMKSLVEASPGPHAFVIVVKIGRMSKRDSALLEILPKLFGSDAKKYTTVVFTHGDELGGQSIEEKIQSSSCVSDLVSMCGGRYCVFDNKGRRSRRQVQNFMNNIDAMVTANRGNHFTSDMFKMAETFIKEAVRTQQGQAAGTNEAPRQAARERLFPYLRSAWREISKLFTLCCRATTASDDEETLPLVTVNQDDNECGGSGQSHTHTGL